MELADLEPRLEAPIPGMSMTHEVGARPWQQPAQYTEMEDVIDYYITRMSHSIDTGLLIMPVLMELMMLIAEQNDVEYITGMERNKKEEIKESVMQNALAKFQKEQDNETDDEVLDKVEVMPQEESMSGLMARRVK